MCRHDFSVPREWVQPPDDDHPFCEQLLPRLVHRRPQSWLSIAAHRPAEFVRESGRVQQRLHCKFGQRECVPISHLPFRSRSVRLFIIPHPNPIPGPPSLCACKTGNSSNCCTGSHNTASTCPASGVQYYSYFSTYCAPPSSLSESQLRQISFSNAEGSCPNATVYAFDQSSGTALWNCSSSQNSDYRLTFCPCVLPYLTLSPLIQLARDTLHRPPYGGQSPAPISAVPASLIPTGTSSALAWRFFSISLNGPAQVRQAPVTLLAQTVAGPPRAVNQIPRRRLACSYCFIRWRRGHLWRHALL
jgi:hypothetical protein